MFLTQQCFRLTILASKLSFYTLVGKKPAYYSKFPFGRKFWVETFQPKNSNFKRRHCSSKPYCLASHLILNNFLSLQSNNHASYLITFSVYHPPYASILGNKTVGDLLIVFILKSTE